MSPGAWAPARISAPVSEARIARGRPGGARPEGATSDAREAAAQFDALLLAAALKPVASALGFYGDLVVGTVTRDVARSERGGLADLLEREISAADGSGS